jgi:hypothetical protein
MLQPPAVTLRRSWHARASGYRNTWRSCGDDAGDDALRRGTDSHFFRWAAASTREHRGRAKFDAAISGAAMRAKMRNF